MLKYDVLCVGSATVDTFLTTERKLTSVKVGDKVLISNTEVHSGGGGTNSAAALKVMGLKVKVLTKLGKDKAGEIVERELRDYKIKNICRHYSKKNTDAATIISSSKQRDRIIYVHKGASRDLSIEDLPQNKLNTRWIYLATLVGKSFNTAKKIAAIAEKKKIKVLFNPSSYLAKKGKRFLLPVLKATTVLVLNKDEAADLLGKKSKPGKMAHQLSKLGPEIVIITDGAKKVYAYSEGKVSWLIPPDVPVIHTAGAGDAFTAGFLAGIIKKYPIEEALQLGQANSCSVIQHIGTKNKLLNLKEGLRMMKKYRMKVHQSGV